MQAPGPDDTRQLPPGRHCPAPTATCSAWLSSPSPDTARMACRKTPESCTQNQNQTSDWTEALTSELSRLRLWKPPPSDGQWLREEAPLSAGSPHRAPDWSQGPGSAPRPGGGDGEAGMKCGSLSPPRDLETISGLLSRQSKETDRLSADEEMLRRC